MEFIKRNGRSDPSVRGHYSDFMFRWCKPAESCPEFGPACDFSFTSTTASVCTRGCVTHHAALPPKKLSHSLIGSQEDAKSHLMIKRQ